jgi:hypothetical protein
VASPNWPKLALDYLRTPRFSPLEMTNSSHSVLAFNLSYLFDRDDLLAEGLGQISALARGRDPGRATPSSPIHSPTSRVPTPTSSRATRSASSC